jgi:hypothetical protein
MVSNANALGLSQGDIVLSPRRNLAQDLLDTALSARDLLSAASKLADSEHWLGSSEDRLEHLMGLPHDWDGYGSVPISEETRTTVLKLLYNVLSPNDALPSLVPGSDGGVNVEWHRPGLTFEVEVEPSGRLCAYFHDEERGGDEWEGDYRDIEPRVGDFISRFAEI